MLYIADTMMLVNWYDNLFAKIASTEYFGKSLYLLAISIILGLLILDKSILFLKIIIDKCISAIN